MLIRIQAGKLLKVLTSAKEILVKVDTKVASLDNHILLQYSQTPTGTAINFLAADKEVNHYFSVALDEAAGEFCDPKQQRPFFSINCSRLLDAISGIAKEVLVQIDASLVFTNQALFGYALVSYDTTVISVESSRGDGYPLISTVRNSSFNFVELIVDRNTLKDMFESTIFSIDPKRTTATANNFSNLILYLSPQRIEVIGAESTRIAMCQYQLGSQANDLIQVIPAKTSTLYFPTSLDSDTNEMITENIVGKTEQDFEIGKDFDYTIAPYNHDSVFHFSTDYPLITTMSKKAATELSKFLSLEEGEFRICFMTNNSRKVKQITVNSTYETLILNLNYFSPPNFGNVFSQIKNNQERHATFTNEVIRSHLKRSMRFNDVCSINTHKDFVGVEITSISNESQEKYKSIFDVHSINAAFSFRLKTKHFDDAFAQFKDDAEVSITIYEGRLVTIEELHSASLISKLYIVSTFGYPVIRKDLYEEYKLGCESGQISTNTILNVVKDSHEFIDSSDQIESAAPPPQQVVPEQDDDEEFDDEDYYSNND